MNRIKRAARYIYDVATDFPRTKGCTRYGWPARLFYAHLNAIGQG